MNRPFTRGSADALVRLGESIVRTLDALDAATRAAITAAMRVYERDVLKDVTWQP